MDNARKMLFRALEKSDLNMVRAALALGASARLEEGDRMPPLMEAINCNRNDLEILDMLRDAGADVRERCPIRQETPLHWAMGREKPDVLNWCLRAGADVNASNSEGWTPLFWAIRVARVADPDAEYRAACLRDAQLLLEAGATVAGSDKKSRTVLHYAAESGDADAVALLLHYGAPVDAPDIGGETALMIAARGGHKDVVSRLIAAGADVKTADNGQETALHLLSELYPDAFGLQHLAVAEILIASGASPDCPGRHSWPPIEHCAGTGNAEMVRLLLCKGADPDGGNGIALQNAVFFEFDDVVALLLDAGADAGHAYGEEQRTPLHVAAHEGYLFGVTALLDKDAPFDAVDIDGETPLMTAVRCQQIEVVRVLLDRGADIRRSDNYKKYAIKSR